MGLFDLCVAVLMFVNSVAILNEERFLARCELRHILFFLSGTASGETNEP